MSLINALIMIIMKFYTACCISQKYLIKAAKLLIRSVKDIHSTHFIKYYIYYLLIKHTINILFKYNSIMLYIFMNSNCFYCKYCIVLFFKISH